MTTDIFTINFHETFCLSRASLSQLLNVTHQTGTLKSEFLISTSLGTNYQKAMPRYAYRAGLLDERRCLTLFGNFTAERDPNLEKTSTQWLLHYHLTAPHGPTAFWHYLVTHWFVPGNTFTADQLTDDLAEFLQREKRKVPSLRSIRSTITIFTGTYLKRDGLSRLGMLEEVEKNTYHVPRVSQPPIWALGYALADYWQAHYGERLTVNLDDLSGNRFAGLFLLGESGFNELLLQLKQEGMIDLYRTAHPYQVVLLQPSLKYALEKLYAI